MRRGLALFCFLSLPVVASPRPASAAERLAVLELSGNALTMEKRAYLIRRVRAELKRLLPAETVVVTRENMQALLDANSGECLEEGSCAVETLRNLGADRGVEGSLVRFGRRLRLHLNLYDTVSGALIRSAEAKGVTEQRLAEALPDACADLLGIARAPDPFTAPPPQAAPAPGQEASSWDVLGVASLLAGGAALAGAVAFGVQATSTQDELRGSPHQAADAEALIDEGRSQAVVANTLAVTSVIAAGYGLWRLATR